MLKSKFKKILGISFLSLMIVYALLVFYNRQLSSRSDRFAEEEIARRNRIFNSFHGQKWTYKSSAEYPTDRRIVCHGQQHSEGSKCDIKTSYGEHWRKKFEFEQATLLPSSHEFDFTDMTITLDAVFDRVHRRITYPISDYSKKETPASTTHILKIDSGGLKEIRIDSKDKTIAYHYDDGRSLVFNNLKRDMSLVLLN